MKRRTVGALVVLALVAVAGFGVYAVYYRQGPCAPTKSAQSGVGPLKATTFGAVTEYALPGEPRWANGITVAADGSVWFGEQALPGLGHFVPSTGMLTEYQWPCYKVPKGGGVVSSIWGITAWNGRMWAADGDGNRLVGLDPKDGSTTFVNTTSAQFPYLPAVAPDGSLWFTSLSSPAKVGRLGTDLSLSVLSVQGLGRQEPIQIRFLNSSFAYMVALDPYDSTDSGVYSFNPGAGGSVIVASKVGGAFRLFYPQSLSVSRGTIWVAQHFPSNLLGYDLKSGTWTTYPTSTVRYENTTLPYFVESDGSRVWFNEHYANKIALLNPSQALLTEYSESDPPASNATQIQNDLTIASTANGLWFTSTSGNYIGFVDAGFKPSFAISSPAPHRTILARGSSVVAMFQVRRAGTGPLSIQVSDSEAPTSFPRLLSVAPGVTGIPAGTGSVGLPVTLAANSLLQPGTYTVAVTVTDGLVYQTVYLFITVV